MKRLQIGVSGNLHSAAEIKATSMDLTQNLRIASEEIKTLRNVAGLIKHDVLSQQTKKETATARQPGASFNPFLDNENELNTHRASTRELSTQHLQQTQRSNMEKLLNENESI